MIEKTIEKQRKLRHSKLIVAKSEQVDESLNQGSSSLTQEIPKLKSFLHCEIFLGSLRKSLVSKTNKQLEGKIYSILQMILSKKQELKKLIVTVDALEDYL